MHTKESAPLYSAIDIQKAASTPIGIHQIQPIVAFEITTKTEVKSHPYISYHVISYLNRRSALTTPSLESKG
ncbi:hypothetical protein M8C21_027779, partial [Ambrosia artemisiifolia]